MHRRYTATSLGVLIGALAMQLSANHAYAEDQWVTYAGGSGPGAGKHIVLVSGDEEYRSEEALPQLGKILAVRHGFRCTVLFAINPKTGLIDPNFSGNIPGLEQLESADLMILFTRFRNLPDEQMQHVDNYLKSGRPVIGIRTATHAFNIKGDAKWARYGNYYSGDLTEWRDGFGRLVLGEHWYSHHGHHRHQSTRGVVPKSAHNHPILRGIAPGSIWGPTDVYGVRLPLPGDAQTLVLGQVVKRRGEYDANDPFFGLRPSDDEPADTNEANTNVDNPNKPMMPIAWTKSYQLPDGKRGQSFTSTIGSSTDMASTGVRQLFVNAVYWCLQMPDQIPADGPNVKLVGEYSPTSYQAYKGDHWTKRAMQVSEHRLEE